MLPQAFATRLPMDVVPHVSPRHAGRGVFVADRSPNLATVPPADALAARGCPLCECGDSEVSLRIAVTRGPAAGSYELRRCSACELIFAEPRLADSLLATLYDEDFYFSTGWPYRGFAEWVLREIQRTRQRRV